MTEPSARVTLDEAKERVGSAVVYRQVGLQAEQGVITSVNSRFVFVRYGSDLTAKATEPSALEWLHRPTPSTGSAAT